MFDRSGTPFPRTTNHLASLAKVIAFLAFLLPIGIATAQINFTPPGGSAPGSANPGSGNNGGFGQLNFGNLNPLAKKESEPVTVISSFTAPTESQPALLRIQATIADSYHIYATTQPKGGPGATVITVNPSGDYSVTGNPTADPAPSVHYDAEIWELDVHEHSGVVTWYIPLEISGDPNATKVTGNVKLQVCDADSCLPMTIPIEASLDSVAAPAPIEFDGGDQPAVAPIDTAILLKNLSFAFLGGLILNLMPCVLPVIGLKVLSFAEQGGESRLKVFGLNLAYSIGLISVFLVLASLAVFADFGWGEQFTNSTFQVSMVILVFAMALSFLGVWEIPIPGFAGTGKANDLQDKEGFSGAFFKGIFTTILATPCSGPFLGTAFGYTLTLPPAMVFLFFFTAGLGMAMPYLLIGIFPSLVKWLPKPGLWMETFKELMGFTLLGATVFLIGSVDKENYLPLLYTLTAVGLACWWIGRTPLTATAGQRVTSWLGGVATACAVGYLAFALYAPSKFELDWKDYSQAALTNSVQSGNITLVDFSAEWCLTCKTNLKTAINTERIKKLVEANGVVPMLADWTDGSQAIEDKLNELGSNSIPLLAIYPANRPNDPIVLRDLITESQLVEALEAAGANIPTDTVEQEFEEPTIEIGTTQSNRQLAPSFG